MRHKVLRLYNFIEHDKAFNEYKQVNESLGDNHEELMNLVDVVLLIIRNELTERQRYCFYNYIIEKKMMKEIAKECGISVCTVSRHIQRAKNNILKYLKYSKAVDKYVSSKTNDD